MAETNFQQKWEAVSAAPDLFFGTLVAALLIFGGVAWWLINYANKAKIERLEQDVKSEQGEVARLRSRLAEFDDKLKGATPEEAQARIDALEDQVAKLGPRRLSPQQKSDMVRILSGAPGVVDLKHEMGSPDGRLYQEDFSEVFRRSGWASTDGARMGQRRSHDAMLVSIYKENAASATAIEALKAAGIEYAMQAPIDDNPYEVDLMILIGFVD